MRMNKKIIRKAKKITEQGLIYCVTELILELAKFTDELTPYVSEDIFEYWIIEFELAALLKAEYEIVFNFLGMTIWARQRKNQAVYQAAYADTVIMKLAKNIVLLPGYFDDVVEAATEKIPDTVSFKLNQKNDIGVHIMKDIDINNKAWKVASAFFLTEEFPSNWHRYTKSDILDFIDRHVTEPYEDWDSNILYDEIEQLANTLQEFCRGQNND